MDLNVGASRSVAVAATCMSFPAGDINNFIVGSEEGVVYQVCVGDNDTRLAHVCRDHP
jgi:dynein intermediate chain